MVAENSAVFPDAAQIERDLTWMTARWHELPEPAVFEMRAFREGGKPQFARFSPDWIDEGVDWAVAMTEHGFNCYVVRNPIRASASGSATDADIIGTCMLWADCDDQTATDNVRRFSGPPYSAAIMTGRTPWPRVHIYWYLDEWCYDLTAWRSLQTAIAGHLGSDKSVVNPSRIMRIGGTVAYPAERKRSKGYIKELATIRTEYAEPRPPVSMAQMQRVFGATAAAAAPTVDRFAIATDHDSKTAEDYADALRRARTDGSKHTGVRDLAASLAGQGVKQALAEAIIRDACPVWDANVENLISSAYQKFYREAADFGPAAPPQADDDAPLTWPTPLNDFDEMSLPRREWVYGYDLVRGYLSVDAAPPGLGKSSNAVVEALCICTGRALLGVEVKERCRVWIVNLEDPRAEVHMRVLAAMKHYRITPDEVRDWLFIDGEDTIHMTLAVEGGNGVQTNDELAALMRHKIEERRIGVTMIDPFVSTHLVNENSNASIQAVSAMFRGMARETQSALRLIHHTRKGNGEDATIDSVRGAGSLIGAARTARVMNKLSEKNTEAIGMTPEDAKGVFRIDDGKQNLAPPAEKATYRKIISVKLANGESVGVVTPFDLPDEWAGMTEAVVNEILARIDRGLPDAPGEEFYSMRPQDKGRWVGKVICEYEFQSQEHVKTAAQAKAILRQWLKSGLIEEMEYRSAAQRKERRGVLSTGRVGGDR